jgi:hypothetical protein
MAKRKKITLVDFATGFPYKENGYGEMKNYVPSTLNNKDFELFVINSIVHHKDYKPCVEYKILLEFFKKGNDLEDINNFYNNAVPVRNFQHTTGAELFYVYSKNVRKCKLPEHIEKLALSGLWSSYKGRRAVYKYAKYVLRDRLSPDLEKGCNDLNYLDFLIIKGYEVNDILMGNCSLSASFYKYKFYLPEVVHNYMIAMQMTGDHHARWYFKMRKRDDKLIKNRLKVMDQSKSVADVIRSL